MVTVAPHDFNEEVQQARLQQSCGKLQLLAHEVEGMPWEKDGQRIIAHAQHGLEVQRVAAGNDPRVLLFTGHRVDDPGRPRPRFPNTVRAEAEARRRIEAQLIGHRSSAGSALLGIAGGASGGDILFHEVCADLGIDTHLYLALPAAEFCRESVAGAGARWMARFDRLRDTRPLHQLATRQELPAWLAARAGYDIWGRNNLWMLFSALATSPNGTTLLALWDGRAGDGEGGTQDLVNQVQRRGQPWQLIDARGLEQLT